MNDDWKIWMVNFSGTETCEASTLLIRERSSPVRGSSLLVSSLLVSSIARGGICVAEAAEAALSLAAASLSRSLAFLSWISSWCSSSLRSHRGGYHYMLRPASDTRINTFPARFALSGEVSLIQTDHVSSEEPACSTRAGSATPAPFTNQACVPRALYISQVAYVFPRAAPLALPEVVPVLEA